MHQGAAGAPGKRPQRKHLLRLLELSLVRAQGTCVSELQKGTAAQVRRRLPLPRLRRLAGHQNGQVQLLPRLLELAGLRLQAKPAAAAKRARDGVGQCEIRTAQDGADSVTQSVARKPPAVEIVAAFPPFESCRCILCRCRLLDEIKKILCFEGEKEDRIKQWKSAIRDRTIYEPDPRIRFFPNRLSDHTHPALSDYDYSPHLTAYVGVIILRAPTP